MSMDKFMFGVWGAPGSGKLRWPLTSQQCLQIRDL